MSKEKRASSVVEKKAASTLKKADMKAAAEIKAGAKPATEIKTLKDVIKEQINNIKSFFKIGAATETSADTSL